MIIMNILRLGTQAFVGFVSDRMIDDIQQYLNCLDNHKAKKAGFNNIWGIFCVFMTKKTWVIYLLNNQE